MFKTRFWSQQNIFKTVLHVPYTCESSKLGLLLRRLPSDTVHPAWALPALSIQMNWDGKPPFIPSNIQATALGTTSATRLRAGRERGVCVCHGSSMCPSLSSLSHKGCFYTTEIKLRISPKRSLLQNKELGPFSFSDIIIMVTSLNLSKIWHFFVNQKQTFSVYQYKRSYFLCLLPVLTGPGIFYGCYMAADLEFEPTTSIKRAARQSRSFKVCGFTMKTWAGGCWGWSRRSDLRNLFGNACCPAGGEEPWDSLGVGSKGSSPLGAAAGRMRLPPPPSAAPERIGELGLLPA